MDLATVEIPDTAADFVVLGADYDLLARWSPGCCCAWICEVANVLHTRAGLDVPYPRRILRLSATCDDLRIVGAPCQARHARALMVVKVIHDPVCLRIVNEDCRILTCRRQHGPIVRILQKPYLILVILELKGRLRGKVGLLAVVVQIE